MASLIRRRTFRSPINDEQWRLFDAGLRDCNMNHDSTGLSRCGGDSQSCAPALPEPGGSEPGAARILGRAGDQRRLVIQTRRPELHLLPWAAMIDDTGAFLAGGDLSVVQSWADFSLMEITTGNDTADDDGAGHRHQPGDSCVGDRACRARSQWRMERQDFQAATRVEDVDILHLEEHGDAVTNEIGDVFAPALAEYFRRTSAWRCLWSCCSGAANSWGESPALCLHQQRRRLCTFVPCRVAQPRCAVDLDVVLSRRYLVPPPAAIRKRRWSAYGPDKFANEFPYANWASMTVYMRAPLDMSALPLNGPRVPQAQMEHGPGRWPRPIRAAAWKPARLQSSGGSCKCSGGRRHGGRHNRLRVSHGIVDQPGHSGEPIAAGHDE